MLLTKEERQSLGRDERRALRKERRVVRRKEQRAKMREMFKFEKFKALAEEIMLEIAADILPGEDKMDEVLEELIVRIDEFIDFKPLGFIGNILEAIDGLIIKFIVMELLRPQVQAVYDHLRSEGKL
jgi:hypothetical protein